jgi:hypothetical protein
MPSPTSATAIDPLNTLSPALSIEEDIAKRESWSGDESDTTASQSWKGKERQLGGEENGTSEEQEDAGTAGYPPVTDDEAETRRIEEVGL